MQALQCCRARHSESRSRDSITEKVALEVEAQEGWGQVAFGVLGRRGCALWEGCRGLRSAPTLERGGVQAAAAAAAKSLQSCPTLCDPRDGSPTGSSVPGILRARILQWVAISFSNA